MSRSIFIEVPCAAGKIVADVDVRQWPTSDTWSDPGEPAEGDITSAWIESHSRALERALTVQELGELYERPDFQERFQEAAYEASLDSGDDYL